MKDFKEMTSEAFFCNEFHGDMDSFIDYACGECGDLKSFFAENDGFVKIEGCVKQPIMKLEAKELAVMLSEAHEDRFSEDGYEREFRQLQEALQVGIDFDKVNDLIPYLYYGNGQIYKLTLNDIKS